MDLPKTRDLYVKIDTEPYSIEVKFPNGKITWVK